MLGVGREFQGEECCDTLRIRAYLKVYGVSIWSEWCSVFRQAKARLVSWTCHGEIGMVVLQVRWGLTNGSNIWVGQSLEFQIHTKVPFAVGVDVCVVAVVVIGTFVVIATDVVVVAIRSTNSKKQFGKGVTCTLCTITKAL